MWDRAGTMENLGFKPCRYDKSSSLPMISVCVNGGKEKKSTWNRSRLPPYAH